MSAPVLLTLWVTQKDLDRAGLLIVCAEELIIIGKNGAPEEISNS